MYKVIIQDENGNAVFSTQVAPVSLNALTDAIKKTDVAQKPEFQMTYVGNRSSNVESVGFMEGTLFVKFQHGTTLYSYQGVPQEEYEKLLAAPSVGKYLTENIKPKYPYKKVN